MDILRSPWRYDYVSSAAEPKGCILCIDSNSTGPAASADASIGDRDEERLVLYRGAHTFVMMNLYPYTSGHLMVSPFAHIGDLSDASGAQLGEMMSLAQVALKILKEAYRPEGFNMGMNIGRSAGAGVRDHLHLHLVPRWCGDVNFMTTTGETRVLPEDVNEGYSRLKARFDTVKLS
jgi:ATP adenylyltransferase